MKNIISKVLREITPPKEDEEKARKIFEDIRKKILTKYGRKSIMVGSVAKDTHVKGQRDLDIFVFFPETIPNKELENLGLQIGKDVLKKYGYEEHWAQHPYLVSDIEGFKVEIVPCYAVKKPTRIKSAVDRTPFHKEYVLAKLNQKGKDSVRLLKAFLRGAGVYGAEERYQGFSGYLCELLIIKYESFEKLLRAASSWKKTIIIDLEGAHKKPDKLVNLFEKDFVVIDPVDKNRNVASAVSENSLAVFIKHSREFLKKPSKSFFYPKKETIISEKQIQKIIKERQTNLLVLKLKKPEVIEEILYSQLRKSLAHIIKNLNSNDFRTYDSDFFVDSKFCYFVIECIDSVLPNIKKRSGPPIYERIDEERFIEKHKNMRRWLEGDKWVVELPRMYRTPKQIIEKIIQKPKAYGIGSYICENIKKAKVLEGKKITNMPPGFSAYLVKK